MLAAIDHVNLVVRDLPAMVAFYRDALGMRVTKEVTIGGEWIEAVVGLANVTADVVYLELPAGPRIELIDYRSPVGPSQPNPNPPHAQGIRHLAFRVDDIESLAAELIARGVEFQSTVATVPDSQVTYTGGVRKRLVYFRDPEDNLLELCEYRSAREQE